MPKFPISLIILFSSGKMTKQAPIMSKISGNFPSNLQELRGVIGHGKICGVDLKIG